MADTLHANPCSHGYRQVCDNRSNHVRATLQQPAHEWTKGVLTAIHARHRLLTVSWIPVLQKADEVTYGRAQHNVRDLKLLHKPVPITGVDRSIISKVPQYISYLSTLEHEDIYPSNNVFQLNKCVVPSLVSRRTELTVSRIHECNKMRHLWYKYSPTNPTLYAFL